MISQLSNRFRARYLDVLASIYLYNEFRGYTALDRVLEAVRGCHPEALEFHAEITKHRADERKHYVMFRRWFQRQGHMPLALDQGYGHIDRFIEWIFRCGIDQLDTGAIIADGAAFERLCRVIVLTEQRGFHQVEILRRNRIVRDDPVMARIFAIIHRDEPDHFLPYQRWLEHQGHGSARWNERAADWCIHKMLLLIKLPALFFNVGHARLDCWPDEEVRIVA